MIYVSKMVLPSKPSDRELLNQCQIFIPSPVTAMPTMCICLWVRHAGGHIVISHPLGRAWHEELRAGDAELVPHALPDTPTLQQLIADLPLRMRSFQDDRDLYLTVLQARAHLQYFCADDLHTSKQNQMPSLSCHVKGLLVQPAEPSMWSWSGLLEMLQGSEHPRTMLLAT